MKCQIIFNGIECVNNTIPIHKWMCAYHYIWYSKTVGFEPSPVFIQYLRDHPDEALEIE